MMGHVDHFLELMRMFSANLLQCRADDGRCSAEAPRYLKLIMAEFEYSDDGEKGEVEMLRLVLALRFF